MQAKCEPLHTVRLIKYIKGYCLSTGGVKPSDPKSVESFNGAGGIVGGLRKTDSAIRFILYEIFQLKMRHSCF